MLIEFYSLHCRISSFPMQPSLSCASKEITLGIIYSQILHIQNPLHWCNHICKCILNSFKLKNHSYTFFIAPLVCLHKIIQMVDNDVVINKVQCLIYLQFGCHLCTPNWQDTMNCIHILTHKLATSHETQLQMWRARK